VALWSNVVIANIEGHVAAEGVRKLCDVYHAAHKLYPEGIAALTMLRSSLKVGDSDTNAEAKRAMSELRHKMLHVSIVIEDKSVFASLVRAVIRTLNSISRGSILSIEPDLEQAVRSVAPYVKLTQGGARSHAQAELLQAVMSVRNGPSLQPRIDSGR
jgi:hypothetical protein